MKLFNFLFLLIGAQARSHRVPRGGDPADTVFNKQSLTLIILLSHTKNEQKSEVKKLKKNDFANKNLRNFWFLSLLYIYFVSLCSSR